jgi:FG-GAP-like repeat
MGSPRFRPAALTALVAGAFALAGPSAAFGVAGDFFQPLTSPESAGDASGAIVSADFDGDTDADLAISNGESKDITILLGDGAGDFTAAASSPVSTGAVGPADLVAADVDNDDDEDLAVVVGAGSANVLIFLNDGSADFDAPLTETASGDVRSIAAGNFDGGTDIDLAVGSFFPANVTVLLNDGEDDGAFTPGSAVDAGGNGTNLGGIAAAPIDNDADTDVVVARAFTNDIQFLSGNGSGGLTALAAQGFGGNPVDIVVGQFNGGMPDLAVANRSTNNLTVLNGVGDGTFTQVAGSPEAAPGGSAGNGPNALATADFNSDGNADIAGSAGFSPSNQAVSRTLIWLGNGAGDFTVPPSSPEPFGYVSLGIVTANFNGGLPDLAISNLFPQPTTPVNILLNDATAAPPGGGGSTTTPPSTTPAPKKCKKGQKLKKGKCVKKKKKKKKK